MKIESEQEYAEALGRITGTLCSGKKRYGPEFYAAVAVVARHHQRSTTPVKDATAAINDALEYVQALQ